jgi:uncharacterized protein YjbI with pentapeptide repeats
MAYLNNNDGLYYTDAEFTNIANGIAPFNRFEEDTGDILYVNGVPTLYKNNDNGLWYTDQGFTSLANGPTGLTADLSSSTGTPRWFINGQPTGLFEDGSGDWNGVNYINGVANATGPYAGNGGLQNGFYINGVLTTLSLWSGHGVWNNKIYGPGANTTHLAGFYPFVDFGSGRWIDGVYVQYYQITDLTGVDFSSVVSIDNAALNNINLTGVDFSNVTSWENVDFCGSTLVNTDFSGVTFSSSVLGFDCSQDASGANFDGATLGNNFRLNQLQGATFIGAVFAGGIGGSNFAGANLAGADFSGATLNTSWDGGINMPIFDGASDITGTIFPSWFVGVVNGTFILGSSVTDLGNTLLIVSGLDLTGVDFSNVTSVAGVYFSDANLTGVDFSNVTNWEGADFNGATLTGAILPLEMAGSIGINGIINNKPYWNGSATNLDGASFSSQDLAGVDFSNVTSVAGAFFGGSNLTGVDFSSVANWEGANFNGATLTGAILPSSISGSYGNVYFINGQATGLDGNGTGAFEGLRYENGTLFTGDFEGQAYVNGVVQNGGGGGGGNNLPPNYKGEWDNFTHYAENDVVSLSGQYWILTGFGGWTVGGAPGLGYGWTQYGTSLVRVSGAAKLLGRIKFAV